MNVRHTLCAALLSALSGLAAPYDANAAAMDGWAPASKDATAKAVERLPFYVRHARGRRAEMEGLLTGQGGEITHDLREFNTVAVMLPAPAAAALAANPAVELIEPVPEFKLAGQVVPWNIDQFQARDIWDKDRDGNVDPGSADGSGVKFCIIDTGFFYDIDGTGPDTGHDDFKGITASGISQITGEQWHFDGNGHGTHVAGTANAVNNSVGVVGVMPGGAELYIVKIFNNSGVWVAGQSNLGAAATACRDAGANVLSMSLGGGSSATEEAIFQSLYDNNNILNIAAAGNDGNDTASFPASYESVVSVAAINEDEVAAEFSQTPVSAYGVPVNTTPRLNTEWDVVEFSGGGVQVLSTVPSPNASVPIYAATANGVTYSGAHVAEAALGNVTQQLVNGGICDTSNPAWSGKVVLCERGVVNFSAKVNNVRTAGGVAALLYNNVAGSFGATCAGACTQPSIPALSLSREDGLALIATSINAPTAVVADNGASCTTCNGGYDYYSGTSMATPGVAAAVGFIWDQCGGPANVTNKQLRQLLRDSAKDLTGVQPADTLPPPDGPGETVGQTITYGAGWDRVTGWGLVQLKAALDLGNTRFGATCPILLEVAPSQRELCTASTNATNFTLTLDNRFTGSATLSASGLPAGTSGAFSPNPLVHPAKDSVYTLSGLTGKSGVFNLQFNVVDGGAPSNTAQGFAILDAYAAAPAAPALATPANAATGVALLPTLTWAAAANAKDYTVELSTSPTFATIAASGTTAATSFTPPANLNANTTYFWRVRANNPCGSGTFSAARSFTTVNAFCATPASAIPDNNNTGVTSTINVPTTGTITDLDVSMRINHTFVGDLIVTATHVASGTAVILVDRPGRVATGNGCAGNDIDARTDDEAATDIETQCAGAVPTISGTHRPNNPLTAFDTRQLSGNWTLNVRDRANGDTGTLQEWCITPTLAVTNQAPVAVNDSIAVNEGATATVLVGGATSVRTNDTDAEDGTPTGNVALVANATNGALTLNTNGTFSYAHNGGETTSDSFTYTVRDSANAVSNTATVNIAITGVNDAPVAVAETITVAEGATATTLVGGGTSVRANDTDAEDGTPSGNVTLVANVANGALTLNTNGTFSYVHNGGQSTSDSFSYQVADSNGALSNVRTVAITITGVNDAPVAVADSITVAEGGTATALVGGATSVRTNDTDAEDGTPTGTVTRIANVANGTLTLNADGTFSYVHNGGQSTTDSFTYQVADSNGTLSNIQTVSIAITGVNDAPVAVADSITVAEGGTATALVGGATSVRTNDTDAEDGTPTGTVTRIANVANGTLTLNADGTFSYVHNGGQTTTDSFTYQVADSNGALSNIQTVSIAITGVNDAPVAVADSITVAEGGTATALVGGATSVRTNDTDAEDGTPTGTVTRIANVANGTLTLNADGTFSYVHNGGQTTTDSFTYQVADSNGTLSNIQTVSIAISGVNDAPIAVADSITVAEGGTATALVGGATSVRINDTDAEDGTPTGTVTRIANVANGTLTLNADGTFSYVHNGGQTTTDSFTYQVADSNGTLSNIQTVSIAITGVNDAPVAVADSITVAEGGTATVLVGGATSVRTNDTDAEDGTPTGTVTRIANVANGTLTLNADGTFSYVHNGGESTADSFSYQVADSNGTLSNVQSVSITISGVNDAPIAVADSITVAEGGTATALVGGGSSVRQNDTDAEDGTPTGNVTLVANVANGSLTLNANGTFSYVHDGGQSTSDSFSYQVADSNGALSNVRVVPITISGTNDAPVAVADSITVAEGGTATALVGGGTSVRQNDTDAEDGTPTGNVTLVANVANGTLTLNANGTFSYVHNGGQSTTDSFTYQVADSNGTLSNIQTVSITITGVNDAPVAVAESITVAEGGTATALVGGGSSVRQNDTDAEDGTPTGNVTLVSNVANGSLTLNANGTFSYVHNGGQSTTDSFTYQVADSNGTLSNIQTVSITITGVNDAPVAVADSITVAEGGTATTLVGGANSVRMNDTDAEDGTPTGNVTLVANVANGSLTLNANGTFSYVHNGGQSTSDSFTYQVADSSGTLSNVQTVSITITGVNDAPVAVADSITVAEGGTAIALVGGATSVRANDTDAEDGTPSGNVTLVTSVANGSLTFNANGTFSYTHNGGQSTADGFTYRVADSNGTLSNVQTVSITITGVNDAPTVQNAIADQLDAEGEVITLDLSNVFADADGNVLTLSHTAGTLPPGLGFSGTSITGTLSFVAAGTYPGIVITASDGNGGTVTETFDWTVANTNRAPAFTAEPYSFLSTQGATAGTAVGTLQATDADGTALQFAITGGNTGTAFAVNATTGAITVATPSALIPGVFTLTVTVSDGSASDTSTVTITVQSGAPLPDSIFRNGFEGS